MLSAADKRGGRGYIYEAVCRFRQMSEDQLAALLAKLKEDAGLKEKLQGAGDLDAAEALAKEAGFDVSKADWLNYQAKHPLDLSDEELEEVSGGRKMPGCVVATGDPRREREASCQIVPKVGGIVTCSMNSTQNPFA